jgi:nitrogen fixation protein FixH
MSHPSAVAASTQQSWWPYAIIAFFILVFCGGIALYLIAASGPSKWLEGNPYEDGLRYEKVIAQERLFLDIGYQLSLSEDVMGAPLVNLKDSVGSPVTSASIKAYLMRPAESSLDRKVTLVESPVSPGTYQEPSPRTLSPGLWIIDFQIETPQGIARTRVRHVH